MGFIKMFKKGAQPSQDTNTMDVPPAPAPGQDSGLLNKDITNEAMGDSTQAAAPSEIPLPPADVEVPSSDGFEIPSPPAMEESAVPAPQQSASAENVEMELSPKDAIPAPGGSSFGAAHNSSAMHTSDSKMIREEQMNIAERKTHAHFGRPIFVEVEDYKRILDSIAGIKNNIKDSENILIKLQDIKTDKEKQFEKWHNVLEDVERKLLYVDKALFEEV